MRKKIIFLKQEINDLKTHQKNRDIAVPADSQSSVLSKEDFFSEVEDRSVRINNLIMLNVPVSTLANPIEKINLNNCREVLLSSVPHPNKIVITNCNCINKFAECKNRPLKITSNSQHQAVIVIKSCVKKSTVTKHE